MEEARNILLCVKSIREELEKENVDNKSINFNLNQIVERINVQLKKEVEDHEKALEKLNDDLDLIKLLSEK